MFKGSSLRACARASAVSVEGLEKRWLLSSVSFENGVLSLEGNTDANNRLTVDRYPDASTILAVVNNAVRYVPASQVNQIRIIGGDANDKIFVNPQIRTPALIESLDGNDSIFSGDGPDLIFTGNGNNRIDSHGGNDQIKSGSGSDQIKPGNGKDKIDPGAGDNTVYFDSAEDTYLTIDQPATGEPTPPSTQPLPPPASTDGATAPTGGAKLTIGADNTLTAIGKAVESAGPAAAFKLIGAQGVAAHPIHVNGLLSSLGKGSPLTARYDWDFGDPSGRYNQLTGWNAAHVYDKPGVYTVRLTITNELGKRNSVSATVTVSPDTRRTIYVHARSGNDANDGSSTASAVRTLHRASALLSAIKNDVRVLFHRGQTFDADTYLSITGKNVLIGAYGVGDKPVIRRVEGYGDSSVYTFRYSDHVVIENLAFDSKWPTKGNNATSIRATGMYLYGRNITVRDNTFLNLNDAINSNGFPTGLLVMDNSAPLATGLRGYFVWGQGTDHVYLGNSAANSTRQHIIRTWTMDRVLVAYNNFTNLDRSNVDSPDYSKGTIEIQAGSYAYVAHNVVHDGQVRVGPRGGQWEPVSVKQEWSVFESNEINNVQAIVYPGATHSMWRNNIIHRDGGVAFSVRPEDGEGRYVVDLNIINNTVVNNAREGQFLLVSSGHVGAGAGNGITFRNNMWLAPKVVPGGGNGVAGIYSNSNTLSNFNSIADNVWPSPAEFHGYAPGGIHYVWPNWSDARGYLDASEWEAQAVVTDDKFAFTPVDANLVPYATSVAATAGRAVAGVALDFYGHARALSGAVSAGAVQAG